MDEEKYGAAVWLGTSVGKSFGGSGSGGEPRNELGRSVERTSDGPL